MSIEQSLTGQQSLRVITPQLQEAIRLLQLSHEELAHFLQNQTVNNPFLIEEPLEPLEEVDYKIDSTAPSKANSTPHEYHNLPTPKKTLLEHLQAQINSTFKNQAQQKAATAILQFVEPTGYLSTNTRSIARKLGLPWRYTQNILSIMQTFDPSGICAENLADCITIQLREQNLLDTTYTHMISNLELIAKGKQESVIRKCKISKEAFLERMHAIQQLNPKPGLLFESAPEHHVVPDVCVQWHPEAHTWNVSLNPQAQRSLKFDTQYFAHAKESASSREDHRYLAHQLNHANWLRKALEQRKKTLILVAQEITKQQQRFFSHGVAALTPMTLQAVANALDIHESTVSRITTNKYIETPQGVFLLKYFFTASFSDELGMELSSKSIHAFIQQAVQQESKKTPLSDIDLVTQLKQQGIHIARRTVAKYREALGIAPSFERKRTYKFRSFASPEPPQRNQH